MISAIGNPAIRRASRLKKARGREKEQAFFVEGSRAVAVAIETGAPLRQVFHTPAARRRGGDLLKEAARMGVPLYEVTPRVMAHLTSVETAPSMIGVAVMRDSGLDRASLSGAAVLAGVRDPATAGSIMATVAATGGRTVIFAEATVDPYREKTVRAAQGAHFVLSVVHGVRAADAASAASGAGLTVVALDEEGPAPWECDLSGGVMLVVPGEDGGLPADLQSLIPVRVAVPGGIVRPALAPRAAVVLYEAARQRESAAASASKGPWAGAHS